MGASHSYEERAPCPGSNPGGRTSATLKKSSSRSALRYTLNLVFGIYDLLCEVANLALFDYSGERLPHLPVARGVWMKAVRRTRKLGRVVWVGDGGACVAEECAHDMRDPPNPVVERREGLVVGLAHGVVRQYGRGDGSDSGSDRPLVHCHKILLDRVQGAPLVEVIHAREDNCVIALLSQDVSFKPFTDLIRPLAVDASIKDEPFGMELHHPVGVLALDVSPTVRGGLEGGLKTRCACGCGITQADDF